MAALALLAGRRSSVKLIQTVFAVGARHERAAQFIQLRSHLSRRPVNRLRHSCQSFICAPQALKRLG